MKIAPQISPLPARRTPPAAGNERLVLWIRRLVYLYLALLIFEGALRKWVVPQLSNPLLIVRDPVVLLIYLLAFRAQVFPRNWFIRTLVLIAFLATLASILVLQPYLSPTNILFVTLYGVRSDFLHLPLIFLLGNVFEIGDVKRIGRWVMFGMIPMALLVAVQFRAAPESFINRTVGLGEAQQITAGGGKIRPPGTFSFVSGVIFYLSFAGAFVLYGTLARATYRNWLLFVAGSAVVIGVAVSGSRSAVASVGLVVLSLAVILLVRPNAMNRFARNLLLVLVVVWGLSYTPIFREGVEILSARFTESAAAEETTVASGIVARTLTGFVEGLQMINRLPAFGYGLGIGTNGGAKFITGRTVFLLAEGEWARVLLESGPAIGLMFLLWRSALTLRIGYLSVRALKGGETLPTILFSAGFLVLLNGQFGQPTSLGFAVLLNGLCLAAMNRAGSLRAESPETIAPPSGPALRQPMRGQSPYAARLHREQNQRVASHGPADR